MNRLLFSTLLLVWIIALYAFGQELSGNIQKAQATEFSEGQQRERIVKAEEAQARALKDIAASLKKLERCR